MSGRTRATARHRLGAPPNDLRTERRVVFALGAVGALAALVWVASGLASVLSGHGVHDVPLRGAIALLIGIARHPDRPALAFPARLHHDVPGPAPYWSVVIGFVFALAAAGYGLARLARRKPVPRSIRASRGSWADRSDLSGLLVRRPSKGRLVVGHFGRALVATEAGHSLLVIGPTQSGKTTGLAIPAILEWDGPVIATSVKTDLVRATAPARARRGKALVFDPVRVSGWERSSWSPLSEAVTWGGARRVAASLCSVQRHSGRSPEDAAFWGALAEKLLAPMLFAAATEKRPMREVVSWIDSGEVATILDALERAGDVEALRSAKASFAREERQLASVYATAEAAVAAFADPQVEAGDATTVIDASAFTAASTDTCYLVAPAHEQERLLPIFVALLREILDAAFLSAARRGRLDPPMLVVLDEAANIAPVANLDALASTAASHGVQLVTIWQDVAQIATRYGSRASTVVNNHRAKLVFPGVSDPETLGQFSALIGDETVMTESVTSDASGAVSLTQSEGERRLLSAAGLRTLARDEAILLYGHLPPVRIAARKRVPRPRRLIRRVRIASRRGRRRDAERVMPA